MCIYIYICDLRRCSQSKASLLALVAHRRLGGDRRGRGGVGALGASPVIMLTIIVFISLKILIIILILIRITHTNTNMNTIANTNTHTNTNTSTNAAAAEALVPQARGPLK